MQRTPYKICPLCQQACILEMPICKKCGHAYNAQDYRAPNTQRNIAINTHKMGAWALFFCLLTPLLWLSARAKTADKFPENKQQIQVEDSVEVIGGGEHAQQFGSQLQAEMEINGQIPPSYSNEHEDVRELSAQPGKNIHVNGYYRRNGTYVRPYYRRR